MDGLPGAGEEAPSPFPKSLDGAPVLLPTDDTAIRRDLDQWCDARPYGPSWSREFEDFGMLRAFGQEGKGAIPVPSAVEAVFRKQYGLARIGLADGVVARFYAVSIERRIRHPGVVAICEGGRALFAKG